MDKNKSRTDLLAAGRKKLQQYRQKKEGKGSASHGKSSKKSGKSDQHEGDADESSTTPVPTVSSQVTEREIAPHDGSDLETVESSLSHSTGISEPDTSSMQSREDQGQCRKLTVWTQSNLIAPVK
ncbi:hypothetical protein CMV_000705 [Castanea mollissima]|uniref:Uncharacterized protein n=1 Tax=Castanea mollissima TaxID=60419 RepID=A0A8J4VYI8_9ROSI|nr:hypothetical protein CMV_000705 [Castanea mollissima]